MLKYLNNVTVDTIRGYNKYCLPQMPHGALSLFTPPTVGGAASNCQSLVQCTPNRGQLLSGTISLILTPRYPCSAWNKLSSVCCLKCFELFIIIYFLHTFNNLCLNTWTRYIIFVWKKSKLYLVLLLIFCTLRWYLLPPDGGVTELLNASDHLDSGRSSALQFSAPLNPPYPTLHCFADNQVGSMREPCIITIIPAGKQVLYIVYLIFYFCVSLLNILNVCKL